MARFDSFLRLVAEQGASDLHFHAGNVPIIRHEGDLLPLPFRVLSELETIAATPDATLKELAAPG